MDMDIPQPDELEWLEANSHLHQDYPEDELSLPPEPCLGEEQRKVLVNSLNVQQKAIPDSMLSVASKPTKPQLNSHKRRQFDYAAESELYDKRSRFDDVPYHITDESTSRTPNVGSEDDADWLQYSPQREAMSVETDLVGRSGKQKTLSRFAFDIDGDCFPVTGPCGGRVYSKVNSVVRKECFGKLDVAEHCSAGLSSEPISALLQQVEQEALTKAMRESLKGQVDGILPKEFVACEQLWVDKYAPNSFMDLLSDEQTNREVLLWLKQWDSIVYGSQIRSTSDDILSALKRHTFLAPQRGHMSSARTSADYESLNQSSGYSKSIQELWNKKSRQTGFPEQKILLLCGPPGLGKTTLAHVAAKHCGYRVLEINASDDRSSSSVESKILDVVEMNSVTDDLKPKCLVIDEIDGALGDGKGAVDVLLKMIHAEKKSDKTGKILSKKGLKSGILSRPVICICNNLYVPALRQLRQLAKVHLFVQPTVNRVVSRLNYICNKEGLRTSSVALAALAEYAECDVRSCLNTLQLLHKNKGQLNMLEINTQVIGRKDLSKGVFDVWKQIFQRGKVKKGRKFDSSCRSMANEFVFLDSLISSCGDYDLILDGIHENILQLQYHDPMMHKTVKCLNNIGISDMIHQYTLRTQQMRLQVYQPSITIIIHSLVGKAERPNIEWPKSYQRYRAILMEKRDILRSWICKIQPCIARHISIKSFIEDTVSPLLHILSPPTLRPVALDLLSEKEKSDIAQLVCIMESYCITYRNAKPDLISSSPMHMASTNALELSLDPPICEYVNFKGYKSGHFVLASAMKQVLVHEVEKQKILKISSSRALDLSDGSIKGQVGFEREEISRAKPFSSSAVASSNLSSSQRKFSSSTSLSTSGSTKSASSGIKSESCVDTSKTLGGSRFFDRFKRLNSKGSGGLDNAMERAATSKKESRPLLFKFNEGYTNAVKRHVRMREFL